MSIPRTMKAAILVEQRKPLVIAEIEMPDRLAPGQVLVKLHCSGICGSQLGEIDGAKGEDRFLPHLLGHEGSGTVVDVGPAVRHVKLGDKVVLHWRKGPGIEAETPSYTWQGRKVNAGWVTTFNEYAIVAENRVTTISPESDLEVASLFGCAVTTGFGVAINNAKVKIGDSVVVYGAGGVGLNIVQASAMMSAHPLIAVDLYDSKLALARELGATHVINARDVDPRTAILEANGGRPVDVFIDNTGIPEIIQLGYDITGPQGRVTLVGVPRKGANISVYSLPLHFGKTIQGSHGGEAQPEADIPRYSRMHQHGRLQLSRLITDRFALEDINQAIAGMRDGSIVGRALIRFG